MSPTRRATHSAQTFAIASALVFAVLACALVARAQTRRRPRGPSTQIGGVTMSPLAAMTADLERGCATRTVPTAANGAAASDASTAAANDASAAAPPDASTAAASNTVAPASTSDAGASAAYATAAPASNSPATTSDVRSVYRPPTWLMLGDPNAYRGIGPDPVDRRYTSLAASVRAAPAGSPLRARAQLDLAQLLIERALIDRSRGRSDAASRAFREAERTLGSLVEEQPSAMRIDEAVFLRAQSLQFLGEMPDARRHYLMLIQRFPSSRFVPLAYFAFGEYFFEQGQYPEARQFFDRVTQFGAIANPVAIHAMFRNALAAHADGDVATARQRLLTALQQLSQNPATADGAAIGAAMRGFYCTLRRSPTPRASRQGSASPAF